MGRVGRTLTYVDRLVADVDSEELEAALESAFGGTDAERRVVARQARDLSDSGKHQADRGRPLTVGEVIDNLADAPAGTSLPSRWNWWLGALDVAYGGYREFQVERVPRE